MAHSRGDREINNGFIRVLALESARLGPDLPLLLGLGEEGAAIRERYAPMHRLLAEDDELGEEGFEVLAVALFDEGAVDVAVGMLAVEEFLEVGEAVGEDAVVGEVEVFEVEVPVVELVIRIAREKRALCPGNMPEPACDDVVVHDA